MKTTCKYCGIVDKPHICPYKKRKTNYNRTDKKIYSSRIWKDLRQQILNDFNNICLWSLYVDGEVIGANTVHHIVELLENESVAYEYDNLIPLEYYNHEYIHELYKKDKKKVQKLLKLMLKSYKRGDRTLGKFKKYIPPLL
ncbi:hypothetical protein DP124_11990 [Clostridium tetani]|uniref:hypothetical protein n=1 Tax=Clostridium tetani TaxID=1513 RepID=UPI00100B16E8|nr:hypothetical protein [Clostridium tetani]RXI50185.1 hypothetical protein DP124_11990 [Clostridium tetani]